MHRLNLIVLAIVLTVIGLTQASPRAASGAEPAACLRGMTEEDAAVGAVSVTRVETMRMRVSQYKPGYRATAERWVAGRVYARVTVHADACPGGVSRIAISTVSGLVSDIREGVAKDVWGRSRTDAREVAESIATGVAKQKIRRNAVRELTRRALVSALESSANAATP